MKRKRIVIIGPVYPYKGGISHYTGLMYRALKKENDVYMVSYKLQYPRILFKREQKDYSNDSLKVDDARFDIHTANPFNWFTIARKIRKLSPNLVIFQWWHPYFSPCYWTISKLLGKIKILFLCHNVFPHERFPLDRFLTKQVLRNGNTFIVHSIQDELDLKSIKQDAVYRRTVLPTFNAFQFQGLSMEEGRFLLGLTNTDKVLLFFGFVREYKGLKYLIQALPKVVKELEHVKLLIVGDFAGDKEEYMNLITRLRVEDYIQIYDDYIPDKEVEKYFAASDLVILPYESATQSGIVQIAYSFEKPVIATNVGGLPEVVLDDRTGYVVEAKNSDSLAKGIIRFFAEKNKAEEFRVEIVKEAERYSWDRIAEVIRELMER